MNTANVHNTKVTKKVSYIDQENNFEFTFKPVDGTISIAKTATGYEARYLVVDESPMSPDEFNDDGDLFLVGYHRDFFVESTHITREQCMDLKADLDDLEDYQKDFVEEWKKLYHIFPLEAYIHSGVCLAIGQEGNFPDRRWDVSQLGFVFVKKDQWKEPDKAKDAARALIQDWNCVLSGDVYGCVVETYDHDKNRIEQDSCWGYYGQEYALEQLKTFA